jgi:hypothetical protein
MKGQFVLSKSVAYSLYLPSAFNLPAQPIEIFLHKATTEFENEMCILCAEEQ